ncbi:MAG: S9 family peptidase [Ignavibacteriales bacterium]|nr:MAG: S9 family peptidase [Ignavibacteriales bacterium]
MKFHIRTCLIFFISITALFSQQKKLTINNILGDPGLKSKSIIGLKWFNDGNKFSFLKYDEAGISVYEHDIETGEEKRTLGGNELKDTYGEPILLRNYEWSPDGRYMLITGLIHARTVKSGGTFYLYDINKKEFKLIVDSEEEQVNIQFSPDGKKLGFVRANNLFITDIETGEEQKLTFDGSETVLNGVFDWVYEEEFSIIKGWEWSPDSRSIAYWQLDQSRVPKVYITSYDSLYFPPEEQYYPKAGGSNSIVRIGVINISSGETTWMNTGEEKDIYIPRIKFTNDPSRLSIQRLNRLQNKLDLLIADITTGKTTTILTETDPCWVDVYDDLTFLDDGERFIWSSERDGFLHFYLYDIEGNLINQITKGDWEISKLNSVEEEEGIIYYSSLEKSPLEKDLYSINMDGSGRKRITEKKGTHSVEVSPNNKFFIDKYSNVNMMPSTVLFNINGTEIRKLIEADMSVFNEYDFSPVEFLSFTTSDGIELNAAMIKPSGFDPSKKYPALIYNYSGPGSQIVKDEWSTSLSLYKYTQNGYVIFWLDNRGTGGRGKDFENMVYKNLGNYEVMDMVAGAKYLISTGFVDSSRIGIYGDSYGGYIAALTLVKAADYFKAAVSGAPVIHWKYYDTIYTERFMQTPQLNPDGYKVSSPLEYVKNLKGRLLLIHGMADDNVHVQNSVVFMNELQKANKQFDLMLYPKAMHGGFGRHYMQLISDFIYKNL